MRILRALIAPALVVAGIASALIWAYRSEPPRPAAANEAPGSQGTFTFQAVDGSYVTVGREAPPDDAPVIMEPVAEK
jgi:hypothetical protein